MQKYTIASPTYRHAPKRRGRPPKQRIVEDDEDDRIIRNPPKRVKMNRTPEEWAAILEDARK